MPGLIRAHPALPARTTLQWRTPVAVFFHIVFQSTGLFGYYFIYVYLGNTIGFHIFNFFRQHHKFRRYRIADNSAAFAHNRAEIKVE